MVSYFIRRETISHNNPYLLKSARWRELRERAEGRAYISRCHPQGTGNLHTPLRNNGGHPRQKQQQNRHTRHLTLLQTISSQMRDLTDCRLLISAKANLTCFLRGKQPCNKSPKNRVASRFLQKGEEGNRLVN